VCVCVCVCVFACVHVCVRECVLGVVPARGRSKQKFVAAPSFIGWLRALHVRWGWRLGAPQLRDKARAHGTADCQGLGFGGAS